MDDSSPLALAPRLDAQLALLIQGTCPCHPEWGLVAQLRAALTYPDIRPTEHWQLL